MADREARHKKRRSWRKLHLGVDAATGEIVAAELTTNEVDDGSQVAPLLDQVAGRIASFTGDGAYDKPASTARSPSTIPTRRYRSTPIDRGAERGGGDAPTQRDRHWS